MPTTAQLRDRLLAKLRELFQLNQPDLDFGFYRVMHAKAREVEAFLDEDLLKIVDEAFGDSEADRLAELKLIVIREMATAKEYDNPKPEEAQRVKEAQAAYNAARESNSAEAEVFDHLYRFFERYYDNGDFVSRRYLTRETDGQAAPFAIPYNGEEVKLHWANADQYYIKTSEAFSHFTVDLMQASEVRNAAKDQLPNLGTSEEDSKRVHFKVVDAAEGAHGNVKESDKRFFILHGEEPIDWTAAGELELRFEYRPDPEKSGQDNTWRKKRNDEAVAGILDALGGGDGNSKEYLALLKTPAPTEKEKQRPLLAKYLNRYTARNTMDYFIHKDLGGFLRRELDFYIKNEVMRLDDIENAEAPAVEGWVPKDPSILDADTRSKNPENKERVLIVWRKLSGDLEKDNAVLDEWFRKNRISTRDFEFDTIYVNGSNNLPNLRQEGDAWKVRMIEEEFHKRMWEVEG